jgi:hypothetical protein
MLVVEDDKASFRPHQELYYREAQSGLSSVVEDYTNTEHHVDYGKKSGPLDELFFALGPVEDFLPGRGVFLEKIHAHLIIDVPGVNVLYSLLHLPFCQLLRFVDHRC